MIGKATDESGRQVQRYVRLTNLIPELLNMVDEKMISFNPAVELSYLSPEQQQEMIKAMDDTQNAPSVSQAKRIKELAQKYEKQFHQPETFLKLGNRLLVIPVPDDAVKSAENKVVSKPPAEHDR